MSAHTTRALRAALLSPEAAEARAAYEPAHLLTGSERDVARFTQGLAEDDGAAPWPEPEPIVAPTASEPFPVGDLPEPVRAAVAEVQAFSQAPLSLVACSALSALSASAQHLCTVERAEGLEGPASLFVLVLAASGERKSAVDAQFVAPVGAFEREAAERARPDWGAYRADLRIWEAKAKGIESAIARSAKAGKPTAADEEALRGLELAKPLPPRVPRLIYTDASPEALAAGLAEKWPSAAVLSSEGGSVLGGHGMGRDSILRALALLNTAWDGRLSPIDRVTRESSGPRTVRLTVGLAAQPDAVRAFIDSARGLARGTGFLARFLVAWPESTQGARLFRDPPAGWPALSKFQDQLTGLLEVEPSFNEANDLAPPTLRLSPRARLVWAEFHDDVERELRPAGMLADVRDFASKAGDNAARLAALFHLLEHGPGGEIGEGSMSAGAALATWFVLEAARFAGQMAVSQKTADALALDNWLRARCRKDGATSIPKRQALQYGPAQVRSSEALAHAMDELMQAGRARFGTDGRVQTIEVNPALLRSEGV
jgi:putative DNA primase/helicase